MVHDNPGARGGCVARIRRHDECKRSEGADGRPEPMPGRRKTECSGVEGEERRTVSRNWIPPVSDLSACPEEDRTACGRHAGPRPDPDCTRPDKCALIRHQRRPCSGPDCANARSPASSFAVSTSSPAGLRSASPCSSTSLDFASLRPLRFIVDFYCPSLQLAVEVDGPIHRYRRRQDERRTRILEDCGVKIIRFASEDILDDVDQVIRAIRSVLPERQSPCCLG